jgi:hypothetical protein
MWAIIIVTILPSVFIAFRLIDKSVFERNVANFIASEFRFDQTAVLETSSTYTMKERSVTLMLLGEPLHESTIENIRGKMAFYDLAGTTLTIKQAGGGSLDFGPLQQGYSQVLEEKNRQIAELERRLSLTTFVDDEEMSRTVAEFRAIAPGISRVSISRHPVWTEGAPVDTMLVCIIKPSSGRLSADELGRIERWLGAKHNTQNVKVYVE